MYSPRESTEFLVIEGWLFLKSTGDQIKIIQHSWSLLSCFLSYLGSLGKQLLFFILFHVLKESFTDYILPDREVYSYGSGWLSLLHWAIKQSKGWFIRQGIPLAKHRSSDQPGPSKALNSPLYSKELDMLGYTLATLSYNLPVISPAC